MTRRDLFAIGIGFGWFPFRRPKYKTLSGIRFRILRHQHSRRRYLHLHGNELTARQVLHFHLKRYAGIAHLIEGTTREVSILDGQLDPNRMFSRTGAEANLRRLNPAWPAPRLNQALDFLDRERPKLLRALLPPPDELLVALHNNGPGYSVNDEVPNSDRVSLNNPGHPHEFCLLTDPADFDKLSQSRFNVVLQKDAPKEDDGSISRLAARRGIRYLNIEAGHGNEEIQKEMIEWAERVLS